jgi:predicted SprT family Zn-dependent metalloprotease
MELKKAMVLAINLMEQHGLMDMGWGFGFDNAKRRFGVCKYRSKVIGLSKDLVELNNESRVKNTILHEIAHALVGHKNGHNDIWRTKALEIGCNGERCYDNSEVATPEAKYEAVCGGCGHVHKKHKRPTRIASCGKCSGGRYNETYRLVWKTQDERKFAKIFG